MSERTSLLINCSEQEAREIRVQAKLQRRTISGYVLNIAMRAVGYDDQLFARFDRLLSFDSSSGRQPGAARPRTTMHLHCFEGEAKRIRNAAKRRETTISGFVLHSVRRSWAVNRRIAEESRNTLLNGRAAPLPNPGVTGEAGSGGRTR